MIYATRAEAKAAGAKHYSPGTPCKNAHVAPRFTSCGYCTTCSRERAEQQRERLSAYYKARYEAKKPELLAKMRRHNSSISAKRVQDACDWAKRNPAKRKAISRQYKAKRRAQEGEGITGGVLSAWTDAMPKVCFYCGCDCAAGFHVDHFIPLAKGGTHVLTNLRMSCPGCNLRKSAKMPSAHPAMLEAA